MFEGSIVALVTPMTSDGTIDYSSLTQLIEWHIESQTSAIVILGTTGESVNITDSEFRQIIETTIEAANHRIPLILGTGSASTKQSIELVKLAESYQFDACLSVTPYYNKPTQEGLYCHYKAIAESSALPQILYNVPGRTAVDLLPDTVIALSEFKNIVAIKEATGSLERLRKLMVIDNDNFVLLSGDDPTALDFMLNGGKGVISVTANVVPDLMSWMCQLALSGSHKKAQTINDSLQPLHEGLFIEPNPTVVKYLLNKLGRIPDGIRLPLLPLSIEHRNNIDKILKNILSTS